MCKFLSNRNIVVGCPAGPPEIVEHQRHGCFSRGAGQLEFTGFRGRIVLEHGKGTLFGTCQQAIAVHHDAVAGAQIEKAAGFFGRLRHRCRRDGFEHFADGGHGALGVFGIIAPSEQHLLAASPGRYEANAHFNQAHIGFGMGLNHVAVQQNLTTAAERHPRGCADDGKRRKLEFFVYVLPLLD